MPCPFPGMDPYIERPAIWPDFHDSVIARFVACCSRCFGRAMLR